MNKHMILLACIACTGCGTIRYGDGNIGGVSLRPAFEAVANAVDKQAPGQGDRIRAYYEQSQTDRVPEGYEIVWTSYLDGKVIDETKIRRKPDLIPLSGKPVEIVESDVVQDDPPPSGSGDELEDGLRGIGGKKN